MEEELLELEEQSSDIRNRQAVLINELVQDQRCRVDGVAVNGGVGVVTLGRVACGGVGSGVRGAVDEEASPVPVPYR
jgi:hypothetical protein